MNHPARIAERAAALDLISNGRLEFGTGRSATWTEVGAFGIDPDATKEMWDEVIRAIPRMWTEDEFEWNGKYFKMPPRNVLPKPIQDPHPPMWVAVSSPETAVQAAERGIGMLGVTLGTPADYKRLVSDYRRIIKHCDPVGKFVNNQVNAASWMYCGEDENEARAVGGGAAFNFFRTAAHLVGLGGIYPSHAYTAHANATALLSQAEIQSLREGFPVGTPEQIIENLRYWEEVGVERVVCMINFDQQIPHPKVLASLERFAKYVMPEFAEGKQIQQTRREAQRAGPKPRRCRREAPRTIEDEQEVEEYDQCLTKDSPATNNIESRCPLSASRILRCRGSARTRRCSMSISRCARLRCSSACRPSSAAPRRPIAA